MKAEDSADGEVQFPDDTPEFIEAHTEPTYDEYTFQRLIRDVSDDPLGGAVWESEGRLVRVAKYEDSWSVEAPPIEHKPLDFASDDTDEYPHIMEYKMDAEHGLNRREAYELVDNYLRGEAELTDGSWWNEGLDAKSSGQQTLSEVTGN